jgi:signal transduction histidine kinase
MPSYAGEIHELACWAMQAQQYAADVVLSWSLQSALTAGTAVAGAGVALTFKRPAMRALAVGWVLISVASGLIWLGLSQTLGSSTLLMALLLALAPTLTPGLASLYFVQILKLIEGKATDFRPPRNQLIAVTATGAAFFGGIALIGEKLNPGRPIGVAIFGTFAAIFVSGWLAALAGRMRKRPGARRLPLLMLQLSFVALAMRSGVNVVIAGNAFITGDTPSFSMGTIFSQVFLLAISAALQLVAVLDEERAISLQQAEQLRQAELAIAASQRLESLGRMAGAVAHDFNNVLTVISMSAHSALADETEAERKEDLTEIANSATRGKALTEQLLAFARRLPQQVTRFDVRAQVERLRGLIDRVAGKSARVSIEMGEELQLIDMDVTQFEQVVMNLILNARDAMPSGGSITIIAGADHADSKKFVCVAVEDTGPGIAPDVLGHIFEPFFSTKREGEGTGLGLAICEGIVRAAGGRIAVKSDLGKGSRFEVLLPRAQAIKNP